MSGNRMEEGKTDRQTAEGEKGKEEGRRKTTGLARALRYLSWRSNGRPACLC